MSPRRPDNLRNGECPDDETLAALLDGAIAPAARAALEAHLIDCDPCRMTVADSAEVLGTLAASTTLADAPALPKPATGTPATASPIPGLAPSARRASGRAPAVRTPATPAGRTPERTDESTRESTRRPAMAGRTSGRTGRVISLSQRTSSAPSGGISPRWIAAAAAILVAGFGAGIALKNDDASRRGARAVGGSVADAGRPEARVASTQGEKQALPGGAQGQPTRVAEGIGSLRPAARPGAAGPTGEEIASTDTGTPGVGMPENGMFPGAPSPIDPTPAHSPIDPTPTPAHSPSPLDVAPLEGAPQGGGAEDPVLLATTLSVASVGGKIEARLPGEEEWHVLVAGTSLPAGASLRAVDGDGPEGGDGNEVVLDGGLALSLRKNTRAVIWPSKDGLEVVLASGALAVSPPDRGPRSRLRVETPQGTVTSAGAPFEVHVQRKGSLVLAREGSGVACETRFGIVGLAADQHTLLLDDRPSPRPRTLSREGREGRDRRDGSPGAEGREGGRRRHGPGGPGGPNSGGPNSGGPNSGGPNSGGPNSGGPNSGGPNSSGGPGRGHCKPPGGPELDKLMPGDGPT